MSEYIREASRNGAKLVVTPELGMIGYPDIPGLPPTEDEWQTPEQIGPYAEAIDGPTVRHFQKLAAELNIYLVFGIVARGTRTHRDDDLL